jgi:hypothetical protein
MTKRIAAVAIALGLPLMLWADQEHTPARAPLDVAWHFCSCGQAVYGHFHRAPLRTVKRRDVTEAT